MDRSIIQEQGGRVARSATGRADFPKSAVEGIGVVVPSGGRGRQTAFKTGGDQRGTRPSLARS